MPCITGVAGGLLLFVQMRHAILLAVCSGGYGNVVSGGDMVCSRAGNGG